MSGAGFCGSHTQQKWQPDEAAGGMMAVALTRSTPRQIVCAMALGDLAHRDSRSSFDASGNEHYNLQFADPTLCALHRFRKAAGGTPFAFAKARLNAASEA